MNADPILAELWAVRDRLAARFDYDVDAIFRHIKAEEAKSGLRYVECPPASCLLPRTTSVSVVRATTERVVLGPPARAVDYRSADAAAAVQPQPPTTDLPVPVGR